jgi:hypothetical protein
MVGEIADPTLRLFLPAAQISGEIREAHQNDEQHDGKDRRSFGVKQAPQNDGEDDA